MDSHEPTENETRRRPRAARSLRRSLLLIIPFLILAGAAGYYFYQYQALKKNSPDAARQEAQTVIAKVGKLVHINDDSDAQVATITDISKLAGQKFFANAKDGDYLILFPKAEKAVLYRASINKVLEIGPFSQSESVGAQSGTAPVRGGLPFARPPASE